MTHLPRSSAVLLAVTLLISACGGQPPAAGTQSNTRAPATASAPSPENAAAPQAVEPPTAAPAAVPATSEAPTALAIVPSGRTPEGYNYLGSPDAPVILQDFSDFL